MSIWQGWLVGPSSLTITSLTLYSEAQTIRGLNLTKGQTLRSWRSQRKTYSSSKTEMEIEARTSPSILQRLQLLYCEVSTGFLVNLQDPGSGITITLKHTLACDGSISIKNFSHSHSSNKVSSSNSSYSTTPLFRLSGLQNSRVDKKLTSSTLVSPNQTGSEQAKQDILVEPR